MVERPCSYPLAMHTALGFNFLLGRSLALRKNVRSIVQSGDQWARMGAFHGKGLWALGTPRASLNRSTSPLTTRHLWMTSSSSTRVKPESERQPLPEVLAASLAASAESYQGDVLVVGLFASDVHVTEPEQGSSTNGRAAYALSDRLRGMLGNHLSAMATDVMADVDFRPRKGISTVTHLASTTGGALGLHPRRLALFCLGKEDEFGVDALNKMGKFISGNIRTSRLRADRVGVMVPFEGCRGLTVAEVAQRLTENVLLGAFTDDRFKSSNDSNGDEEKPSQNVHKRGTVELFNADSDGVRRGFCVAAGVILTKELVNAPPNVATPQMFADVATELAQASNGSVTCTVLEREDCERLGMGAFLGVAQGSDLPPKFIHLKYVSPDSTDDRKKVCLIGKGVTHDTGGYNLKTAGSMIELMKFDCGGAAACLGTMKSIALLAPHNVELNVIMGCCENMISGKAYHPGDILTASNGKTIEVLNTDAEGRLTLADALIYAQRNIEPLDALVDIATLTGACVVALGNEYSGLWCSNDQLAVRIEGASRAVGENVWRMPLATEYRENLKGKVSDLKNIGGGRFGGAITAALFLQEFVGKNVPWAHLDIAGTVWNEKGGGATGVPARMLIELVETFASP